MSAIDPSSYLETSFMLLFNSLFIRKSDYPYISITSWTFSHQATFQHWRIRETNSAQSEKSEKTARAAASPTTIHFAGSKFRLAV